MKFAASLVLLISLTTVNLGARELTSPDGEIVVAFDVTRGGGLVYRVAYRGKPILSDSRLGLEAKNTSALAEGFRVVNVTTESHDETWRPVYGERSEIRDSYNQMAIDLEDEQKPPRRLKLTFRAYDEGVAFCYTIPQQSALKKIHVTQENSEFVFLDDHKAWAVYSAQGRYGEVRLSALKSGCERPLTVQCDEDAFVALAEARLVDFARMKLSPAPGRPYGLISSLSSTVEAELPLTTPWRVIMLARSAGYRPTGYSRTYPNLMTQEGIAGDETAPSNEQTLTILFTRMLAGAGDNTICYYDPRVTRNSSHAYQLAKAVCVYSPWQFLYWYDRPAASPRKKGGAGGTSNVIGEEPELEFFDRVPTVWDETKVLHGRIGRYAVIARRRGDRWFVGCMNSAVARTLEIPLTFLDPDKAYTAHVYRDDASVPTRTHVKIDRLPVSSKDVIKAGMSAQGGQAIRIEPAP